MPVIGFLSAGPFDGDRIAAFHRGLADTGYIVGRNLDIVYRNADGQYDRLPAMATDLVGRRVSVICTAPTSATLAAKTATATIPIVFNIGPDPARAGLVASLNHPGGNPTGIARLVGELALKQMSLLHEATPKVDTMGFLVNPTNPRAAPNTRSIQIAAESQKLKLVVVGASRAGDLEMAFETLVRQRAGSVIVFADSYLTSEINQIVQLAAHHAIPAIYPGSHMAEAGGLMSYEGFFSYGSDDFGGLRQWGVYTGRILKGEKPADMPVMLPNKFEFVINLKTAKALGLTIPETLLATADEIIQ
jgi:putative ABC transport system substrate-binding protein